ERLLRQLRSPRRQAGPGDQLTHLPPGTMRVAGFRSADVEVQRADSRDLDLGDVQRGAGEREAVQRRPWRAEVKQRGDQHVAGDPADGIEDQRARHLRASGWRARCDWRAISAAEKPAEQPLSMFTTLTLAAQELSMASSAAIPPRDAP